jgi:hypothetical protein
MRKDEIGAIFCICFGLFYLIASLKYDTGSITNPQPGFFPRIIGLLIVICSFSVLFSSLRNKKQKDKLNVIWEGLNLKNILSTMIIIVSITLYLLILNYVGFLFSSPVLIFLLAWVMGGKNWIINIVLGIVSSGLIYWLFWIVMRIYIPQGSLWGK